MLVISYICTFLNYILYCTSRFVNNKKTMLTLDIFAKILTIIALYLLGSLSGSYSFVICLFSVIFATIKESLNKKWVAGFFIFQALFTLILITQFEGISTILIFLSSTINLIGNWFLSPQNIRKLGILTSLIYLTYQISIKNYAGLLEFFVLLSNILSYKKNKSL